ncbi:two-component system, OmpR family, sensor histidine kinase TctE [Variovorax sp. HW608]|uniref:sensor histidine kinase n=1 Tax=Variovorax sp. HW608 TaxID=1034889 RepID=UPI00081FBD1C|nr:sensor histidine kinase [Variovorax sp. HW608]SCK35522.1 two-component system, OmpR family, sensor histidine kinase TctE [Variovorax sp. HW608]
MFWKQADSLQFQLLRWLLIPLLLLLLVNAWFSNRTAVATANLAFDRLLMASADAIAEGIEVRNGGIAVDLPYAALQLLESNMQERVFYRVVAPDGKTLTGYDDLPLPASAPVPPQESVAYSAQYRGETIHLLALNKQVYGANPTAPVTIVVAATGGARNALSREILIEGLTRQGLLILAAGLLVAFGLLRGLEPLRRLHASVTEREPSDLSPIDPSGIQKEVRPLIQALNLHMGRVANLLASRERLIMDASHQMRTPLAEMRMQIEYSVQQNRPELSRATLIDTQAGIDRLARLISQILLQARLDPDVLHDQRIAPVDLSELALDTALEYVAKARRRSMDLSLEDAPQPVVVMGNALLLRELIANLIDNAIAYGRHGGSVAIRLNRDGGGPVLEIEDDGPGIPLAERDKVFERFYRAPGSAVGGSGLGLSIVRDICIAHRSRIELRTPSSGVGLAVRIHLQEAGPQPADSTPDAT